MTTEEVQTLAERVLRPILGPVGFVSADVREGLNHVEENSLFVTVHFTPTAAVTTGKTYGDALMAVRDALREQGEKRFPYLDWDYPDPAGEAAYLDEDER